jgi:uncharacterized delta-60 repeat protein
MLFSLESLEPRRLLSTAGQLDPSFGIRGRFVDASISGFVQRMIVEPDGSLITAGSLRRNTIVVSRYTPDGRPDKTFNGTGHSLIRTGADVGIGDLHVLADGRIEFTTRHAIARLLSTGKLDPSLNAAGGQPGISMLPLPAPDDAVSAIQPDGRFVFAYSDEHSDPINGSVPVQHLGRLNLDGSADASFGSAGVITSHPIFFEEIRSMAVTPSGNIAIAGSGTYYGTLHQGFADVFDPAGNLVAGYIDQDYFFSGAGGLQPWSDDDDVLVEERGSDNKLHYVIVGPGHANVSFDLADVTPAPGRTAFLLPMAVDAAGDIYAGGSIPRRAGGHGSVFAVARFTPDGQLDPSYGTGGLTQISFRGDGGRSQGRATVADLAFDPDGRLVIAGSIAGHPAFARLLNAQAGASIPARAHGTLTVNIQKGLRAALHGDAP